MTYSLHLYVVFIVCIALLFLCSCSTFVHTSRISPSGTNSLAQTDVVLIESLENIESFTVIGKIHVHNKCNFWLFPFRPSEKKLIRIAKKEAATIGANTISDMKFIKSGQFEWFEKHGYCTAVLSEYLEE